MAFGTAITLLLFVAAAPARAAPAPLEKTFTPVEKVINLIKDLIAQSETKRDSEGEVYGKFACWCKETTEKKSDSIKGGEDTIGSLSSEVEAKTAEQHQKESDNDAAKAKKMGLEKGLQDETASCLRAQMEYDAENADLTHAIASLDGALESLKGGKASFLQTSSQGLDQALALADAMGLIEHTKVNAITGFLQVDPDSPEYKYHSQGIIDLLNKLHEEYQEKKNELDAEWEKTHLSCEDEKKAFRKSIESTTNEIETLGKNIDQLAGEIAKARENLVEAEGTLKDDQLYMKDMTKSCEDRANDFDQRSRERAEELDALNAALKVLTGRVLSVEGDRALLQAPSKDSQQLRTEMLAADKKAHEQVATSFLQRARVSSLRGQSSASLSQAKVARAAEWLSSEGKRLGSTALSSLAQHLAGKDPFRGVKELIQKLIERLVREATAEATKKGFCDTELGKAHTDRDFRLTDVKKLNAEIYQLEVTQDKLEAEIDELKEAIEDLNEALETATKNRAEEKALNLQDIQDARSGLAAVKEALEILKTYYRTAARSTVALLEATPLDEDTSGAGFQGAYKGNQAASKGIIGMLQVIVSDFETTLSKTTAAENKAAAEFVVFDRTSKADISGKTTRQELDEADLTTTKANIENCLDDLKMNQNLLDEALQTVESLKPTCIDTGMSYEDRVAKREEEMEALKKALCMLDADSVESECQ